MSAFTLHIKMLGEFSIRNEFGNFTHINTKAFRSPVCWLI